MAVTFAVDDVAPRTSRLPALRRIEEARREGPVLALGGDLDAEVVDIEGLHPLLAAVHLAFAEHRRLVLSPDAVWLTLAQGVARHVWLHGEALRSRLVRHAGKKELAVIWDGPPPRDPGSWAQIVHAYRSAVADEIGAGPARLFVCDFSTTTELDRLASEVVLMDAMAPCFEYGMLSLCGIPEVTLLGTPQDWRRIRQRVDVIAELDLARWARSLALIADGLVASAEGRPDVDFWKSIYKLRDTYSRESFGGWIGRLFPYLRCSRNGGEPNPLLDEPFPCSNASISIGSVPAPPSRARVRVTSPEGARLCSLELEGGLTSVVQEPDGALRPVAGFAVREAPSSQELVVARIRSEHAAVPRRRRAEEGLAAVTGTADVMALHRDLEEATLFAGDRAWRIRPPREHTRILLADARPTIIARLVDLPDGTFLAAYERGNVVAYVRGRADALAEPVRSSQTSDDLPIVGTSLIDLLERALDTGGRLDLPSEGPLGEVIAYIELRERRARRSLSV